MSDVTALEKGQLTVEEFIAKVAAEFSASPLMKLLAPFLLQMLQVELTNVLESPTAAQLIVGDIQTVLAGGTPAIGQQVKTGAVALVAGLVAGGTNVATGAQPELKEAA